MRGNLVLAVLALVVLMGALAITTYGILTVQVRIPAVDNIYALNLQVYSDPACTSELSSLNWTTLSPGQTKTVTCYLKSTSTANAVLSMSTADWLPSQAASYLTLSWDREGYSIKPNEVVAAALTLHVDGSIQGITSFGFTVILTASG
jgi:hypothetical protein